MTGLRRDEAERRAELVRVESYDVELDLRADPAEGFSSRTVIRFTSPAGASTFADVQARAVFSVELNGVALAPPVDGRLTLPDLATSNELVVDAVMDYSHDGEGLHRHVDPADGLAYLYAMSFLDAAPRWFACFDQPDLKAPVTVTVRCPDDWTVAGNAPAERLAPGHWRVATAHPLATYFTTLVAGPYHSLAREHDGTRFVLHVRRSLAEHLDRHAEDLFAHTFRCFDELHRLFGVRYPWGEYHQAFVPDFNAGAMENPGCVTLRDNLIFRSPATLDQLDDRANTIAHEMAHMWFGNLVTMRWWDDLWLNESFAEYLGYRVCAAVGIDRSWAEFGIARKPRGLRDDRRPSTHPVAGNAAEDTASALNEFDGISYTKGAAVLRQLAVRLGDEVLLDGLRRHFAAHRFGTATFTDLMTSFEAAGAVDLGPWADAWLRTSGLDTLQVRGTSTRSLIERAGDAPRPHALTAAAFAADGTELARRAVLLDPAGTSVAVAHPPAALVLADAADESWAKVTIADWSSVPALLPALDPLARVAVWNALQLAAADADLGVDQILDVLGAAVHEDELVFAHLLAWGAVTVAGAYLEPRGYAAACARLSECAAQVLDGAVPGSGRQLAAARALTDVTDSAALLRRWLAGDGPPGQVVDVDLRWRVLARLAALGEAGERDIAALQTEDRSSTGAVQATRCRTLMPDAAAKAVAWQAIVADGDRSNYELYAIAENFWHPLHGELTEPYVERYFAEIPATDGLRSGWVAVRLAQRAFPWTAVAPRTLALADALLARTDLTAGVRRAVVDGADDLRRALAVRSLEVSR